MSLQLLNKDFILRPCGLVNTGTVCYLNSIWQALLSCTSLTEFFMSKEKEFAQENNLVALEYINLIKQVRCLQSCDEVIDPTDLFEATIAAIKKKYPDMNFGNKQEDSGEGLHLFLDAVDNAELYRYFMCKYNVKIWCTTCVDQISEKIDEACVLEIPAKMNGLVCDQIADAPIDPLNAHIRQYLSVLEDYKCSKCDGQKCCQIYQLACAPEIIAVMFNKFYGKTNVQFPDTLSFPALGSKTLTYKIVAKIEHAGGMSGGHYWAHCLRKYKDDTSSIGGTRMYSLNDQRISDGSSDPTANTYIVLYHVV